MKPKVYVTNNNPNYDYSPAEKWGELINMTQGYIPAYRHEATLHTFENYAKTASEDDYLLLSGSNFVCALAVVAWMKHSKSLRFLQHSKEMDENKNPVQSYQLCDVSYS